MAMLLVDAHVHFHPCFSWDQFLGSAAANFATARRRFGLGNDSPGCLLLTEATDANYYADLQRSDLQESLHTLGWDTRLSHEPTAVTLQHHGGDAIIVVAGRQVRTRENLEVLALGSTMSYPDQLPILDILRRVHAAGALPVIPWGFGKWWGARGRALRELLHDDDQPFFLGDNGGRPAVALRPTLLTLAEHTGRPILSGSDPLPLPHHVVRPGSFGFLISNWTSSQQPATDLKSRIRSLTASPPPFGHLSSFSAFVRSQFAIRYGRHRQTL